MTNLLSREPHCFPCGLGGHGNLSDELTVALHNICVQFTQAGKAAELSEFKVP